MFYELENFLSLLFVGGGFTIVFLSKMYLSSTYKESKKIKNKKNMTGCEVARKILDDNDLKDVYVVEVSGELSDHYDPSRKVVRLSKDVFHGDTIASLAVSAHICGYALQDKENNLFMRIRANFLPFINALIALGYIGIVVSLCLAQMRYLRLSVALLLVVILIELITLPIEMDASKKALKELEKLSLVEKEEEEELGNMLKATVLIYVSSVISVVLNFLKRIIFQKEGR